MKVEPCNFFLIKLINSQNQTSNNLHNRLSFPSCLTVLPSMPGMSVETEANSRAQVELVYTVFHQRCFKKNQKKKPRGCTITESIRLLLPCTITRVRSDQKWSFTAISELVLPNAHLPILSEFKRIYMAL